MSSLRYLITPFCNSFFISPTTTGGIETLMTKVKSRKATGPFSRPTLGPKLALTRLNSP